MLLNFRNNEDDVAVQVNADGQDYSLVINGQDVPLQVRRGRTGAWLVATHQGNRKLYVAAQGNQRWVFLDGAVHILLLPELEHADEENEGNTGPKLISDMPGKVVQVLVEVGDFVKAGQTLVIMESMKMETELATAVSGTVSSVHVSAGQIVGQGVTLVEVEPGD